MNQADTEMLQKLITLHEGVRAHAYKDTKGYTTIGIGRCVEMGVGPGLRPCEITFMFENDMRDAVKELAAQFSWFTKLTPVRQAVMIDLQHQLGLPKLVKLFPKFLSAMEKGLYGAAGWEIVRSKLAPARASRLKEMMTSGQWPSEIDG